MREGSSVNIRGPPQHHPKSTASKASEPGQLLPNLNDIPPPVTTPWWLHKSADLRNARRAAQTPIRKCPFILKNA